MMRGDDKTDVLRLHSVAEQIPRYDVRDKILARAGWSVEAEYERFLWIAATEVTAKCSNHCVSDKMLTVELGRKLML